MTHEYLPADRWREKAACRTEDPRLFDGYESHEALTEALLVCARCPVIDLCWADALQRGDQLRTIRGGSEPTARMPGTPCGTVAGAQRHRKRGTDVCEDCMRAEIIQRRLRERRTELRLRRTMAERARNHETTTEGIML